MKPSILIQILTDGGIEGPQAAVVGVILNGLRCDKCEHWGREYDSQKEGHCKIKNGNWWLSYDFCSRWSKKYV